MPIPPTHTGTSKLFRNCFSLPPNGRRRCSHDATSQSSAAVLYGSALRSTCGQSEHDCCLSRHVSFVAPVCERAGWQATHQAHARTTGCHVNWLTSFLHLGEDTRNNSAI